MRAQVTLKPGVDVVDVASRIAEPAPPRRK
jgi:hypothetical protein